MLRLLLFGLLFVISRASAQTPFVGTAVDAETGEPLPGATAVVLGQRGGTAAGPDGAFRLTLPSLPDTVVVRFVGFATAQVVVTARDVRGGVVRETVRLSAEPTSLGEAVVSGEPPGERLWRRVLRRREALAGRVGAYGGEVYSRLVLLRSGALDAGKVPLPGADRGASVPAQLTEALSNVSWRRGRGLVEEVVARRRLPQGGPFRWLALNPVPDLYLDDALALDGFSVPSPLAPDALRNYAFRLGETLDSGGFRFLDVAVIPRRAGLLSGRIRIVDTLLVVAEADLRRDGARPSGTDIFDADYAWTYASVYANDALRDSLWMPRTFTRRGSVTVNLTGYRVPTVLFEQQSVLTLVVPGFPGDAAGFPKRYGSQAGVYGGREVYALGRRTLPLDSLARQIDTDPRFLRASLAEMLPPQEGIQLGGFLQLLGVVPSVEGEDE